MTDQEIEFYKWIGTNIILPALGMILGYLLQRQYTKKAKKNYQSERQRADKLETNLAKTEEGSSVVIQTIEKLTMSKDPNLQELGKEIKNRVKLNSIVEKKEHIVNDIVQNSVGNM